MSDSEGDVIDLLVGVEKGSYLDAIRAHRPEARENAQKSYLALFAPKFPGEMTREERYALAVEASQEGHFDWDARTDEIFASVHLQRLLGLPADAKYRTRGEMSADVRYAPGDLERLDELDLTAAL